MIRAHSLPLSASGLLSVSMPLFLFLWICLFVFFKLVAPVASQPAKAPSDRSECVRVTPDDAFYCNLCFVRVMLQLEAVPQKLLAATTATYAVLHFDFVFNVQVPWPQIYVFFVLFCFACLFLKPHQECFDTRDFMLPSFPCDDFKLLPVLTTSH